MPQEAQQNVSVRTPNIIINANDPVLLLPGATYPAVFPLVFPLNYQDDFLVLPQSTGGYGEVFGFISSDQPFSFALYHFNDYDPDSNSVLNRFDVTDKVDSWPDELLVGPPQNQVAQISIPVSAPFIFFALDNTGAAQMNWLNIFLGFRTV
jgi:hypothetical protein